ICNFQGSIEPSFLVQFFIDYLTLPSHYIIANLSFQSKQSVSFFAVQAPISAEAVVLYISRTYNVIVLHTTTSNTKGEQPNDNDNQDNHPAADKRPVN
ncbi:MAG: hypothetical protein K1W30_19280, partial [Lachnospiraceae bacterium]